MAKDKNNTTQVVVIGGGPGGYAAAFRAADLGMKVTLVDPEKNPGGVCLYRGCIPTKALLHATKVKSEAMNASDFGIEFTPPKIDINKLIDWKESVVSKLTSGLGQLVKQRKINHIRGMASFQDKNSIKIKTENGGQQVNFEHAIIATGSKPAMIPDVDINHEHILTSKKAMEQKNIPKKLLVIGAGYIGLELATVYHELGSKVSVAEMTKDILPGQDRELVTIWQKANKNLFEEVMTETKVKSITPTRNDVKVTFENSDGTTEETYNKVLVAIGRKPLTDNLGLDKIGIKPTEKGFIEVNEKRQTRTKNIYAIGDVTGNPMLAHKATHEGIVAAEVIAGKKSAFEPQAIPAVIYTHPEIAWCGLTQEQANEKGVKTKIGKFPWGASGRALSMNNANGLTKLVIDTETERILGIGIVGENAGELIAEGVVAVEMGALASDLKLSIHPHPTLSETIMEAAAEFYEESVHIYKNKK